MTRWRLTECRIAGAMTTWSGAAAFDRAPLVLSSSEHPDQVLVVRRYADGDDGGAAAEGLLTSSAEWDGLIQSGNAMALDHRPAAFRGAWLWLFRPNWPLTRDLAIEALKAEGHLPDQPIQGEADVLGCLVDDTRTDGLRDAWANRLADEAAVAYCRRLLEWEAANLVSTFSSILDKAKDRDACSDDVMNDAAQMYAITVLREIGWDSVKDWPDQLERDPLSSSVSLLREQLGISVRLYLRLSHTAGTNLS